MLNKKEIQKKMFSLQDKITDLRLNLQKLEKDKKGYIKKIEEIDAQIEELSKKLVDLSKQKK